MLNRANVTLSGTDQPSREVFTSRSGIAYVELQARCPNRLAVNVTPLPGFDHASDYLFALVREGDSTRAESLYGVLPDWAATAGDPTAYGALRIAHADMTF